MSSSNKSVSVKLETSSLKDGATMGSSLVSVKKKLTFNNSAVMVKLQSGLTYVEKRSGGSITRDIDTTIAAIVLKLNEASAIYTQKEKLADKIVFDRNDLMSFAMLMRTLPFKVSQDNRARFLGLPIAIVYPYYVDFIDKVFYVRPANKSVGFKYYVDNSSSVENRKQISKCLYSFDRFLENQGLLSQYASSITDPIKKVLLPLNFYGSIKLLDLGGFIDLVRLVNHIEHEQVTKERGWILSNFYENLDRLINNLWNNENSIKDILKAYNRYSNRFIVVLGYKEKELDNGKTVKKCQVGLGFVKYSYCHGSVLGKYGGEQEKVERDYDVFLIDFKNEETNDIIPMYAQKIHEKEEKSTLSFITLGRAAGSSGKISTKEKIPTELFKEYCSSMSKKYILDNTRLEKFKANTKTIKTVITTRKE
jgi:hypothetical protein